MRAIADKRQSICSLIVELEEARAEAAWLKAYETDGERYKVGGGTTRTARQGE